MYRYIIILVLLMGVACEDVAPTKADTDDPADKLIQRTIESDTFDIALGESILRSNSGVEVGFSEILTDSRCPLNVQCYWAGMARIAIWLKAPDQDTLFLEPVIFGYVDRSSPGSHRTVLSDHFGITLQQLDPYPIMDTTGVDLSDTIAYMAFEQFSPPLDQSVILLVNEEEYRRFEHNDIDPFGIDSLSVINDSLLVYVNYGGGCNEHDFYTFGSLAWMESSPPIMPVTIVHDGHLDFCLAFIHETLQIDLGPVKALQGYGNEVYIELGPQKHRVYYSW